MFTRTCGRARRTPMAAPVRLLRDQLQPTRRLPQQPAGVVVDGIAIYPAECCTEHLEEQERARSNLAVLALYLLGGVSLFGVVATLCVPWLHAFIATAP